MADQLDVRVQIHLHETATEVDISLRDHGKRPYARLEDAGLVNRSLLAVHGVHLSDTEIERFAEAGVSVAHCPSSNLKLASGIAPVARFLQSGVNVALGTDGAASNNLLDIFTEMRAAALLAKAAAGDASAVTAADTLHMATLGGASALGLEHSIGSISTGKWADLTSVDLSRVNSQPVYDVISQLVYATRADQVSDVWVAGRHQVDSGRLTQMDVEGVIARSNEWRERIATTGEI